VERKLVLRIVLILAISFTLTFTLTKIFNIDLTSLEELIMPFGAFAPIVYSIMLFLGLSIPLNPISDFLLVNLAAILFTPTVAVIATFCAHSLALTVNYWLARHFGPPLIKKFTSENERMYLAKLEKKVQLGWIFAARFILPLTTVGIDIVSYAAGLAKLSFVKFLLVSIVPWTILNIAYFYSTNFFKEAAPYLFFLPVIVLVSIPIIFFAIFPNKNPFKKLDSN